ncbi:helix-turn-helix transcriptional regulator [Moorellaceae bacterium AZ2]
MVVDGCSRLAFLMDKLGISGKELAKVLNVHYSLVSKWRNGGRSLKPRSPYLTQLIEYFLTVDSARKYKRIREILENYYPDANLESKETLSALLRRWLSYNPTESSQIPLVGARGRHRVYQAPFEVYKGNEGRREIVLHLLDMVLSLPKGQELYLFSDEDTSWLVEDSTFLEAWRAKYMEVLRKGTHATIIHTISRDPKLIVDTLAQWLPLHTAGYTSPYYYPKNTGKPFKMHLTIVKDKAALASTSVDGLSRELYTRFYCDPITVRQLQQVFMSLLFESRPLFKRVDPPSFPEALNHLVRLEQEVRDNYFYNIMPFFNTMPRDSFIQVLVDSGLNDLQVETALSYYDKLNHQFRLNIANTHYRYILDLREVEWSLLSNTCACDEFPHLVGIRIHVSSCHFYEQLTHFVQLMEEYPNLEVALICQPPVSWLGRINVWLKDSSFMALPSRNADGLFTIDEPMIVHSFWQFFKDFWNSIPSIQRDKNWIKKRLLGLSWQLRCNRS